jgi:cysteine-rich secretory family protein
MIVAWLLLAAQPYDHGNPTADEQFILEVINRARANPRGVGGEEDRLKALYSLPGAWTLNEGLAAGSPAVIAKPPLAFNSRLQGIARTHSLDMWTRGFFDHVNPDGKDPFDRMADAGYVFTKAAENIAAGSSLVVHTPLRLEDNLMIDTGITDRGHRVNLLDIDAFSPVREIGLGYYTNATASSQGWRCLLTQDFGRAGGPFLLGVVYWDKNSNGFYDPGEGLGGVTITIAGLTGTAVTSSSGGYAIPVPTTVVSRNVTATGINLPGGSMGPFSVGFGADNVKWDFIVTMAAAPDTDGDGLPNFWETAYPASAVPGSDQDLDTFSSLLEFQGGGDPTSAASTPVPLPPSPAPPPPPPPGTGGSGSGKKSGGCGALGPEFLLAVALLGRRRRRR